MPPRTTSILFATEDGKDDWWEVVDGERRTHRALVLPQRPRFQARRTSPRSPRGLLTPAHDAWPGLG